MSESLSGMELLRESIRMIRVKRGRLASRCFALKGSKPSEIEPRQVSKLLKQVESNDDDYIQAHEDLLAEDEELADDSLLGELEIHNAASKELRLMLQLLLNQAKTEELIACMEESVGDLNEDCINHGYSKALDDRIQLLQTSMQELRVTRSKPGVKGCKDLDRRADALKAHAIKLAQAKTLAEETKDERKSTAVPVDSPPSVHQIQNLSLDVPTYDGDPLGWKEWWDTFSTVMKEHSYLTPHSQKCHFRKAMLDDTCSEFVNRIFKEESDYTTAVEIIRAEYEDPRALHMHHHKVHQNDTMTEYNRESMQKSLNRHKTYMKAMEDYSVTHIGQVAVMHGVTHMTQTLLTQWKKASKKAKTTPNSKDYIAFLKDQIQSLGSAEIVPLEEKKGSYGSARSRTHRKASHSTTVLQAREGGANCSLCKGSHFLCFCPKYKEKTVAQRTEHVRSARLCWNCLSKSHRSSVCNSEHRCKTCGELHHTTLHKEKAPQKIREQRAPIVKEDKPKSEEATSLMVKDNGGRIPPRVSATAMVVATADGLCQRARAQFDSGSTISLITRKLAQTLKAPKIPNSGIKLCGVTGSGNSPYKVEITLIGRHGEHIVIEPHVQDSIVGTSTRLNLKELRKLPFLNGLPLADPDYQSMSRVDLLLDVETSNACFTEEVRSGPTPGMRATNTIFGWVVSGGETVEVTDGPEAVCSKLQVEEDDPVQIFRSLVALEDDHNTPWSAEEEQALKHFEEHVKRDKEGRYYVSLPRRQPTPQLGKSKAAAIRRYLNNERALKKRGQWKSFAEAVDNYFDLGHAEVVPEEELQKPPEETYYLPMHGVTKEESTTTKLRVVFDASAITSTGQSLNDTLLAGPSLHPLLTSVLTSFRNNAIAVTADIGKMFRGIGLNPEEHDFHRFMHRGPDELLRVLRMKRLTFGIKSSPFLANQVLKKVSEDYKDEYPLAAELVAEHFYVDDCLAGAATVEEAFEKITQAINLTKEACLELKKVRSNSPKLLALIPERLRETADLLIPTSPSGCSKTLGLHWGVREDAMYVAVPQIPEGQFATRRRVASIVAKIFDLLGFYSPAILQGRLILQESWDVKGGWDTPLPEALQCQWKEWIAHLSCLAEHPIPRYLGVHGKPKHSVQLHGFADASFKAFGAVIYQRSFYQDSTVSVDFVVSKSRVVPKPKTTIPRLELCSAVMLAQLMEKVMGELGVSAEATFYWSDSTVVLGWLRKKPGELKTFVCNRTKKIQDASDIRHWRHVDGILNPADLLSRGVPSQELIQSKRWWHGPPWLILPAAEWPHRSLRASQVELPEVKITTLAVEPKEEFGSTWCSDFDELVRAAVYMRRFLHQKTSCSGHITVLEYMRERRWLFQKSQQHAYSKEYELLKAKKYLPRKNPLALLAPYLDAYGIMRVGGRLQKAGLKPTETHPVILSVKSNIVQLFLKKTHEEKHHAGASTIMATLAFHYHVPTIKRYLRKLTRSCVRCRLQYARTSKQQMGELPECRTQIARPFSVVGMDFAGPFKIKRGRVRDPVKLKAYVCVFVCYVTHAAHLELVSDMTTEAFLAALSRFVSKRGSPDRIESDNGSNFVGAAAKLKRLTKHLRTPECRAKIEDWCMTKSVIWKFTPPRSPHFGSLWEAAVGAMKRVLVKAVKKIRLDYEEFTTVLGEVEAILNSRPLVPIDAPADDAVEPLTAGHFLVGAPLTAMPFQAEEHERMGLLRRWNLVQRIQHDLWVRWKREYLSRLHKRQKDVRPSRSFQVGDIVIEKNADTFQRVWPIAVVTKVKPGPDGLVRVVNIRRNNHKMHPKIITRGIENLVHLFSEAESSEGGECLGQEIPRRVNETPEPDGSRERPD